MSKRPPEPKDEAEREMVELTCPTCRAKVRIAAKDAERTMRATCPNGHEVPLVRAL